MALELSKFVCFGRILVGNPKKVGSGSELKNPWIRICISKYIGSGSVFSKRFGSDFSLGRIRIQLILEGLILIRFFSRVGSGSATLLINSGGSLGILQGGPIDLIGCLNYDIHLEGGVELVGMHGAAGGQPRPDPHPDGQGTRIRYI